MALNSFIQHEKRREITLEELLENNAWKSKENGYIQLVFAAFRTIKQNTTGPLDDIAQTRVLRAFEALRAVTCVHDDLDLEDYIIYEIISVNDDLFNLMPRPTLADSKAYQKFFYTIEAMIKGNILAHRMSIDGAGQVGKCHYAYSGSTGKRMVTQMQQSVKVTLKNNDAILAVLFEQKLPADLLDKVLDDLHSISFIYDAHCEQRIETRAPIYMGVNVVSFERHVIAVGFYDDVCIVSDRGNLGCNGIRIFAGKTSVKEQKALAKALLEPSQSRTYLDVISLLQKYYHVSSTHDDYFQLPMQIARNCSWLSCAKSMPFMALYFRIYESKSLKKLTQIGEVAKACHQIWSPADKLYYLRHYLTYYATEPMSQVGPDKVLLAKIYLTTKDSSQSQRTIKMLLESSGYLTSQALGIAYQGLIADVKSNLGLACQLHGVVFNIEESALFEDKELCAKLADLFLSTSKLEFEQTFKSCFAQKTPTAAIFSLKRNCTSLTDTHRVSWLPSQGIEVLIQKLEGPSNTDEKSAKKIKIGSFSKKS